MRCSPLYLIGGFQSTPSVGRATISKHLYICVARISIHALRGEGDFNFRPVPPFGTWKFQSTPSVGRATSLTSVFLIRSIFQSTPSVGRATLFMCFEKIVSVIFQSTPSVGRATKWTYPKTGGAKFQSTPSVGRATKIAIPIRKRGVISIHALRGEGDSSRCSSVSPLIDFNPRPPWGGRLRNRRRVVHIEHFNPRPPWGGRPLLAFNRSG